MVFSYGCALDVVGQGRHFEVGTNSAGETADIRAATDGGGEVRNGESVACSSALFKIVPIGPDVGTPKIITEGFALIGDWRDAVYLGQCFTTYRGAHFGFDFLESQLIYGRMLERDFDFMKTSLDSPGVERLALYGP